MLDDPQNIYFIKFTMFIDQLYDNTVDALSFNKFDLKVYVSINAFSDLFGTMSNIVVVQSKVGPFLPFCLK